MGIMAKADFHCSQCGFFELTDALCGDGDCRRSAPEIEGWPVVSEDYWCGDFEPSDKANREAKRQERGRGR